MTGWPLITSALLAGAMARECPHAERDPAVITQSVAERLTPRLAGMPLKDTLRQEMRVLKIIEQEGRRLCRKASPK